MASIEYPSSPASVSRQHQADGEAPRQGPMIDLGVEDLESPIEDMEIVAKLKDRLEHVVRLYNSGKLLFPRALLEGLNQQIEAGKEEVCIHDLDDVPSTHSLKVPALCSHLATTYCIGYTSIQLLTYIHPSFPTMILSDQAPVSILYTHYPSHPDGTLEEVCAAFNKTRMEWLESGTCQELQSHLSSMRFSSRIHKIVAFGLGTLAKVQNDHISMRSYAQHAAIATMATILRRRGISGGKEIQCYAQDPWYDETDVEFLKSIGITVVNDPKGFLEIDEFTLVFSVCPNIPVKQIVADVQWPGAMIWNTVSEGEETKQWQKRLRSGEEFWMGPLITDPDSKRVCDMVSHYIKSPLLDPEDFFGDLTVYVK
ncbi:hypothetical protein BO94DRAFT_558913 [Aspergillus sclerotioniger CBS 115572]|uniref:SRR1-like domain-containing protein n=1 Tax=Aspergillus sclerotioniger CBS 115572 TaxID=1450535 RepID=A0A317VUJ4_9EURO|nr:hypothetical protein BO94DRAFT_558913 [Aspergillus sclerotioniger CBS 115572]PWY78036.1 hypothetical protein BO94DRAFT_558913 [Aspergillus sclerotioniger CBS 115572]